MKKHRYCSIFTILFLLIFCGYNHAAAFRVAVTPRTVQSGDAFALKVTGVESGYRPSALLMKKTLPLESCGDGCFITIGAVDIEKKPGFYAINVKTGKKKKQVKLRVRKATFKKMRLMLPDEKVFLEPDDLEIVRDEKARLKSLLQDVSKRRWDGNFILPLDNKISTTFGTRRIMNRKWVSVHRGIDIRGREGEEVRASNTGRVILAEKLFFGGNTVMIDHGQGIYTMYMHLSGFKVNLEDTVSSGDIIGYVGSSGRSTGPHLHFGVQIRGINVNPVSLTDLEL